MTGPALRVLVLDQARGVWGAQRYLLRLAPLLGELGVELILAGPSSLELHCVWRDAGLEAIDVDLPIERSIRSSGRPSVSGIARESRSALLVARLIADVVRANRCDAIWANAHWIHVDAGIAGRMCHKPVVLHLHEEAVPGLGCCLRAGAVRIATRTVAVSDAVAAGLPGFARKRVSVIPNGVDTDALSPATEKDALQVQRVRTDFGIGADDVMLLAATRIDPVKRIEDLIATVRSIDDSRVRLVIAGSTSAYPDYEQRVHAEANGLPTGRVVFCGGRDDMTTLFRASDVVIHAGTVEGMPLGLVEAQSCGKPVVAYGVAGVPQAVLNGTTGLLTAPRDVAALADAVCTLSADSRLRAEMGAAARAHALTQHRIETQVHRNAALLTEMCAEPRPIG